ncbi:MAG TPA: nitroreductase [Candidatus Marinimicrobia bacterium]|nr:nitroreductase [Candidatus Neomarinimicrobiota bacterium]
MKKIYVVIIAIAVIGTGIGGAFMLPQLFGDEHDSGDSINAGIKLPEPKYSSSVSIEQAMLERRSVRAYQDEPLTLSEVAQLLWSAQGITDSKRGFRTAPSAGTLYPLEVYVVIGNVEGIAEGVYKYKPHKHELVKVRNGDVRDKLAVAALGQACVREGAIVIVFSAVYERTTRKYGDRGVRYVHMEAGHAAQNVCLQAVSLNLGTVVVGAFRDDEVSKVLNLSDEERPLYILPVGKR